MQKIIDLWKKHAEPELVKQIEQMSQAELADAFGDELKFGTAGMRGIIGPGPNRMNIYSVMKATYGYAKFLINKYPKNQRIAVVIGTDNRHQKEDFSRIAAGVLMQFGIRVMKSLIVPTPLVSFAIREVKAQGGIMITASHNPPNYSGYKVYDQYGGQLLPQAAAQIAKFANEHSEYLTYQYRENRMAIPPIFPQIIQKYQDALENLEINKTIAKNLKIVFSPQHGTAAEYLPPVLKALNYQVIPVQEQMDHDPNFSHTKSPNPEDPIAYELGKKYLIKNNGDILITTDPDADRIGVMAKDNKEFKILNGNQLAAVIFEYLIINQAKSWKNPLMIYSYVSSDLLVEMAKQNNIKAIATATGFKWIANLIEKEAKHHFVFGFEESYGCLINDQIARDKDALQAAILVAEIANWLKTKKQTLWDFLQIIYQKYGYYYEKTTTQTFEGANGNHKRKQFMDNIRQNHKRLFPDSKIIDLQKGFDQIAPMDLIKFQFPFGAIAIRPSGTEPKIKFYQYVIGKNEQELIQNGKKINILVQKIQNK